MSGAYHMSPRELFWCMLTGITIFMLWATGLTFRMWRVEIAGVWATGQIIGISHCYDSHGKKLATVNLDVSFTDTRGIRHISQSDCEDDRFTKGQSISVRYLPGDPGYILTREDIGGGQGSLVVVLVIIDITLASVLTLGATRQIKRFRSSQRAGSGPRVSPLEIEAAHPRPRHRPVSTWSRLPRRLRRRTAVTKHPHT